MKEFFKSELMSAITKIILLIGALTYLILSAILYKQTKEFNVKCLSGEPMNINSEQYVCVNLKEF